MIIFRLNPFSSTRNGKTSPKWATIVLAALATLLLVPTPSIYAQDGDNPLAPPLPVDRELRFEHITTEDGLSEGRVWSITQDHRGFMWFTTYDGLNRYDGYEFKVYKQKHNDPNSPGGIAFWVVSEDRQGMIWAGSHTGGGLSRFDPTTEQWTRFQHDPDDPHSLSSNNVYAIFEDSSGVLWIGTEGGGLNRFEGETQEGRARFTHYRSDPDDPLSLSWDYVVSVYEDRSVPFGSARMAAGSTVLTRRQRPSSTTVMTPKISTA